MKLEILFMSQFVNFLSYNISLENKIKRTSSVPPHWSFSAGPPRHQNCCQCNSLSFSHVNRLMNIEVPGSLGSQRTLSHLDAQFRTMVHHLIGNVILNKANVIPFKRKSLKDVVLVCVHMIL